MAMLGSRQRACMPLWVLGVAVALGPAIITCGGVERHMERGLYVPAYFPPAHLIMRWQAAAVLQNCGAT